MLRKLLPKVPTGFPQTQKSFFAGSDTLTCAYSLNKSSIQNPVLRFLVHQICFDVPDVIRRQFAAAAEAL